MNIALSDYKLRFGSDSELAFISAQRNGESGDTARARERERTEMAFHPFHKSLLNGPASTVSVKSVSRSRVRAQPRLDTYASRFYLWTALAGINCLRGISVSDAAVKANDFWFVKIRVVNIYFGYANLVNKSSCKITECITVASAFIEKFSRNKYPVLCIHPGENNTFRSRRSDKPRGNLFEVYACFWRQTRALLLYSARATDE